MKLTSLALLVSAALLSVNAMAADGEINFTGTISDSTCALTINDVNGSGNTVTLGTVPTGSLKKANDTAGAASFSLSMAEGPANDGNCNLEGKKAKVRFMALSGAEGANGEWLANAGSAENVAVQINDASGHQVSMGQDSSEYDAANVMNFTANFIAVRGAATPGDVNAKAAVSVNYE